MSIEEGLRRDAAVILNYDRGGVISAEVLGPYAACSAQASPAGAGEGSRSQISCASCALCSSPFARQ